MLAAAWRLQGSHGSSGCRAAVCVGVAALPAHRRVGCSVTVLDGCNLRAAHAQWEGRGDARRGSSRPIQRWDDDTIPDAVLR